MSNTSMKSRHCGELGIPSGALIRVLNALERHNCGMHSLLVARHGEIACEAYWQPFDGSQVQMLYSLSKSFTSTAVGFAVAEKRLSIEDKVVSFFPQYESVSQYMREMKVRHLLTMNTGHDKDPTDIVFSSENWVRTFIESEVEHPCGSKFVYNTAATFMLSAIVQKVTGEKVFDYLKERLFIPLGMECGELYWFESPDGINQGGTGFHAHPRDILALAQCYLEHGCYNGLQVIPREWADMAGEKQTDNGPFNPARADWTSGYGFQFWRCAPEGAFRGDGAFGQYCIVLPRQDMAIAITSAVDDMQSTLKILWEELLPYIDTPDTCAHPDALAQRLSQLRLPAARGALSCPDTLCALSGDYTLETPLYGLCGIGLALKQNGAAVCLRFEGGETRFDQPYGENALVDLPFTPLNPADRLSAVSVAIPSCTEVGIRLCGVANPSECTLTVDLAAMYVNLYFPFSWQSKQELQSAQGAVRLSYTLKTRPEARFFAGSEAYLQ